MASRLNFADTAARAARGILRNRGGLYSYDKLERPAGVQIYHAEVIHPLWQDLVVGTACGWSGGAGWAPGRQW